MSPSFGGLTPGPLADGAFVANSSGEAPTSDHRFIFETDARLPWFDADGSGNTFGVQIATLDEPGWTIGDRSPYSLTLARRGANPDESYVLITTLVGIGPYTTREGFLRAVREHQEKDDPQRFRKIKDELSIYSDEATDCAKAHQVSEDKGAFRPSGGTSAMIVEAISLVCAHPKKKSLAVYVGVSQRYDPGHRDGALLEKADAVFRSLEFSDL